MAQHASDDIYAVTLFNAEIPEVTNPTVRRRPPPDVPIGRALRDGLEDEIEEHGVDGLSWAWSLYFSPYVNARVLLVLSDCRTEEGLTVAVLLAGDPERDPKNLRDRLMLFHPKAPARHVRSAARAATIPRRNAATIRDGG